MGELLLTKTRYDNAINIQRKTKHIPLKSLLKFNNKLFSIELCANTLINGNKLDKLNDSFCSVTWLGQQDVINIENVGQIPAVVCSKTLQRNGHEVLLHLAGRNLKNTEAITVLDHVKIHGIRNIFVLQGDDSQFREIDDIKCDLPYAVDLVRLIRKIYGDYFCVGVAAYPAMHPKSKSRELEFMYLQKKVNAGADFIITQAIFDTTTLKQFLETCKEYGITVPIFVGIFLFNSCKNIQNMIKFCNWKVPDIILGLINNKNDATLRNFSIFQTVSLLRNILNSTEVLGFHVFTLNNFEMIAEVCNVLGFTNHIERPLKLNI